MVISKYVIGGALAALLVAGCHNQNGLADGDEFGNAGLFSRPVSSGASGTRSGSGASGSSSSSKKNSSGYSGTGSGGNISSGALGSNAKKSGSSGGSGNSGSSGGNSGSSSPSGAGTSSNSGGGTSSAVRGQSAAPQTQVVRATPAATAPAKPSNPMASHANNRGYFTETIGDTVNFLVDSADLTPKSRGILDQQAEWIKLSKYSVLVEGHADEQGTREYNLALGARRAVAVRDYLSAKGVPLSRISVVTFGKERPLEVCSTENCYSRNRRSVTVVK